MKGEGCFVSGLHASYSTVNGMDEQGTCRIFINTKFFHKVFSGYII